MTLLDLLKSLFPEHKQLMSVDVSRLDAADELRARNEAKLAEAKELLGNKWILHPDNRVLSEAQKAAERQKWRKRMPIKLNTNFYW